MFGYLDIEKATLQDGQRGLWQTFMCGLCFSTKNLFGNFPRTFITNDVNLFNVLFHSVKRQDVAIEQKRCFSHPVKKRSVLKLTELTNKLSVANVLLTYWNLYDDVLDDGGVKKKLALKSFKSAYEKARKRFPDLDETLNLRYGQLQSLEKSDCDSVDRVSHAFALLSQEFCKLVLEDDSNAYVETLCYNVGKWIYLIDALDDVKKDIKKRSYNVFVKCYNATCAQDLVQYKDEIQFVMYSSLNRIAQSFNDLNLTKYTCILKNVLFESIRNKTQKVLDALKSD